MKLYNNSSNRYTAIINGKPCNFDRKAVLEFDYTKNMYITLKSQNCSTIHLNWIDMILGLFSGDCTVTILRPDYKFKIDDNSSETITIKDNNWNVKEQLSYNACYADGNISDEEYIISDMEKIRKKHKNFHLFLTSLFPVGLISLILCFVTSYFEIFAIIFAAWLLIFGIPSVKETIKFKQLTKTDRMNQKLCAFAVERRNGSPYPDVDESKSGKLINKIIKKMFKFDEEK